MQTNLILVHSGNRFPNYINDCIELANRYNFKIHLILETKFHNLIEDKNVILVDLQQTIDDRYSNYILKNYNSKFRDGFFPRTSSRFILIDNYIKENNIESFFHIENDIAIFSNLSNIQSYLNKSKYDISIVMDNYFRCVPSIIWYRDCLATNKLANFIYYNNNIDDMQNLARFFHKNRDSVTNFPIVPLDFIDKTYNINYGNMYKEMQSIFDGAAIGQYLYGIDTLGNSPTQNTIGFINETCVFDVSKFDIELQNNRPVIHHQNTSIPINNLHIHSKNFKNIL